MIRCRRALLGSARWFASFEMTDGEWQEAQRLGESYVLYLVAKCATTEPVITKIANPAGRADFEVTPLVWRLVAKR
jgi:hypothetical protein